MSTTPDTLATRWEALHDRVRQACRDAGRAPEDVNILPVSKTFGLDAIGEAIDIGLTRFGENKVQEIRSKAPALEQHGIDWVMIGHLQSNKAKYVARLASEIQSLDRPSLAHKLHQRLELEDRDIEALVQIKTSTEPSKYGLAPEALPAFLDELRDYPRLKVRGLMTIAIHTRDPDEIRACFRRLRELRDAEARRGHDLPRLSMGMSGDFPIAIAEGSTEVRIGTAIFGKRPYPDSYYWPESGTGDPQQKGS